MNKDKSSGNATFSGGLDCDERNTGCAHDGYEAHKSLIGASHVPRASFYMGDSKGAAYAQDYDMRRAHQEEVMRFQKHQERMVAIDAAHKEEDDLILLIL